MTLSTRSIVSRILFLIGSLLSSTSLVAATLSFSGDFTQDDQVELFSFSVDVPSLVLINTYSYNGGGQANGNNVSSGGFDPLLALFDSTGALIKQDDDSGEESDAQIFILLEPGDYTASLAQLENFANGPNLSDGFSRAGESDYTGVEFG
ncbi:MAG: DVUA0089 family protein, partial [Gammaproteobacteria bacterium]